MNSILSFTPSSTDGCAFYRSQGVLSRIPDVYVGQCDKATWASFANADITFMQRPYNAAHINIAKMANDHSPLWIDYDDLLTEVSPSNPAFFTYCKPEIKHNIVQLLNLADVVSVSTQNLGLELAKLTSTPIHHIPNAYNDYVMPVSFNDTVNAQKRVVWRGTDSHQGDLFVFNEQIAEAIEELPDVQFLFVGYAPWMLPKTYENVAIIPPMDLIKYLKQVDSLSADVTLVPLENSVFNSCKSNIAELETARSGSIIVSNKNIDWAVSDNVVDYVAEGSIYKAVSKALDIFTEKTKDQKCTGWEKLLDTRALSTVNSKRANLIERLLS